MTDQEATEIWNSLSTLLSKLDLDSVTQRIEVFLREGRSQPREIQQFEERPGVEGSFFLEDELRRRPGPRSRYLAVVDYTPREVMWSAMNTPDLMHGLPALPSAPNVSLFRKRKSGPFPLDHKHHL